MLWESRAPWMLHLRPHLLGMEKFRLGRSQIVKTSKSIIDKAERAASGIGQFENHHTVRPRMRFDSLTMKLSGFSYEELLAYPKLHQFENLVKRRCLLSPSTHQNLWADHVDTFGDVQRLVAKVDFDSIPACAVNSNEVTSDGLKKLLPPGHAHRGCASGSGRGGIKDFLQQFEISEENLCELHTRFFNEVQKGLGKKTNAESDMKCFITYVQDLPTGEEKGKFLALDLGGSRFRVLMVELKGNNDAEMHADVYDLTKELMLGSGTQLFDHIAKCLYDFAKKHNLLDEELALGFTFSFPCIQKDLSHALLARWTKGFNSSGVVNADVGDLLREAIARRKGLKISIVAVLNDTTGTLMSCAHRNTACRIGLIIGTGTNVCYVECVENVELLEEKFKNKENVIINVEWGAFGERGALDIVRTEVDKAVDSGSLNKGSQIFEKMVSGMYLGELVRQALICALKEKLVFTTHPELDRITEILTTKKGCVESFVLSDAAKDTGSTYTETRKNIMKMFDLCECVSDEDCKMVKSICDAIARRAGLLVGVGLASLLNRVSLPMVVVGVDGSVYRFHQHFDKYMRETIDKLIDKSLKYDIMLSEDGSGRGAALVAAVVSRQKKKS